MSYTPPPKKDNTSTSDKSVVFSAEPVNATYSSQDCSEASTATFDVGSEKPVDYNATYQAEPATAVNDATFVAESETNEASRNNVDENDQFIEAEVVEKPQQAVNNIVEILKSSNKDDEKMPSPIPAPRAVNKTDTNQVVDDVDSKHTRSTRTKQKQIEETSTEDSYKSKVDTSAADTTAKRSIRTKAKNNTSTGDEEPAPTKSTRTRQKSLPSSDDDKTASEAEPVEEVRSTRTKQKQLAQSCSDSTLTKGAASPGVRELAAQVLSPAMKQSSSTSRLVGGYTGSPVWDRVRVSEQAMRDSAGLKSKSIKDNASMKQSRNYKRRSSIADSLKRVSAARNLSVNDVIAEQEVNVVKKSPTIRKSPSVANTSAFNNSRAEPVEEVGSQINSPPMVMIKEEFINEIETASSVNDQSLNVFKIFDAKTNILNNDNFQWKYLGKKIGSKSKSFQNYICDGKGCSAKKRARKATRREAVKID